MKWVFLLLIGVTYNGESVNVEQGVEWDTLYECQLAAGFFVEFVAAPGYEVTVSCEPVEVNTS